MQDKALKLLCQESLHSFQIPPDVKILATQIMQKHQNVRAILAYGSALRGVALEETLVDFYLLTDDFSGISPNPFSQWGCKLVPPNVYYAECHVSGRLLRSKYAILPLQQFAQKMKKTVHNPYFWARFSQPTALVYGQDEATELMVTQAIAQAMQSCFAFAKAQTLAQDPLAVWCAGYRATYGTEFRSEKISRPEHIVQTRPAYYIQAAELLKHEQPLKINTTSQRLSGKALSILRLMKAAFTFQGGADYLAWKIERHSGEKIPVTNWMRRHPILASLVWLPRLLKKGAIR